MLEFYFPEEDKVTITTTIGRHVALQMTIDAEWLDDLSNMDSATAAQWSARYVQMVSVTLELYY